MLTTTPLLVLLSSFMRMKWENAIKKWLSSLRLSRAILLGREFTDSEFILKAEIENEDQ